MDEVETVILTALAAKVESRPALTDELLSLSIDSLAMAELALEIEQKLKVRLNDGILEQKTVGDLVKYVKALVARRGQA